MMIYNNLWWIMPALLGGAILLPFIIDEIFGDGSAD